MQERESVEEKETHEIPRDFEIQKDHLISARRPHREIVNKRERICRLVDVAVPADRKIKI